MNLAKGFRGGERQTALLIETLASRGNLQQTLVCRKDSPLREVLRDVSGLRFVSANHQLAGHGSVRKADTVHAHEAKAVHWAFLHHGLKGVPYIVTRRVDTPVKDRPSNRWCYRRAVRRVAISRVIMRELEMRGWGGVDLIPSAFSGLPTCEEATRRFHDTFAGKFLVGHAGALVDRHKGQRVLLEAARLLETRLPELQFVFLGDGEDREMLERESADQPNVAWLGFKENIGDYLAGLDMFAFPSRNEGLGSVLLDVMNVGVPIVATDVGGIPDIVQDNKTGLLVPKDDAIALSDALTRLYRSESLRAQLSQSAKQQLDRFSPEAMADSYISIYESIFRQEP
ncbi:glycosyltransferase family 4 protein [Halomonas aquatica]|uniref:Glycosyltransferase family 4 protein n=1 Tax=Halomonas aquatica TaxID=3151123 RepID=A0ABV1NJB9_9GAMM